MAKRLLVSAGLIAVILAGLMGTTCGNHPPEIVSVAAAPNPVEPNNQTTISCSVSDADGDPLTYEWYSASQDTTYTASSFIWTAPAVEGSYSFYLTVSDGHGGVDYDSSLAVVVDFAGIAAVTMLPAQDVATREATLYWTSAAPSWYSYQLFRADRRDVQNYGTLVTTISYDIDPDHNRFDTTWTDTDLEPGREYYYAVVVEDSAGNEAWSNEIPVFTESFELVGSQPLGGGHGVRLVNTGNYIFCAAREQAVKGFTVTSSGPNPAAVITHPNNDVTAWAWDLAISGNILHVAFGRQGYVFYDITNPQNPDSLGLVDTAALMGEARAIYAEGSDVFIGTTNASGLHILHWYNVPPPTGPPVLIDTALLHDVPTDIYVDGNYVYVAVQNAGLETVNWSQATGTITFTNLTSTNDAANRVYVHNDYAYVAATQEGMVIMDLSSPGNPVYGGQWIDDLEGNDAQGIYFTSGRAYLADGRYGLRLLDIVKEGDPLNPVLEATKDLSEYVGNYRLMDVWVTNQAGGKTWAILADWYNALHMIEW